MRIGYITGITAEARLLKESPTNSHADILCAGASTERAYDMASSLFTDGCDIVISFGVAGALDPSLKSGDLLLAERVINENGESFETNIESHKKLTEKLSKSLKISNGTCIGSNTVISSVSNKLEIFQNTQARAVDMESIGVARAAHEKGRPFLIVRAISDPASQSIPQAVLQAVDSSGNIQIGKILSGLASHPLDLFEIIKLAKSSRQAFSTLSRVASLGFDL